MATKRRSVNKKGKAVVKGHPAIDPITNDVLAILEKISNDDGMRCLKGATLLRWRLLNSRTAGLRDRYEAGREKQSPYGVARFSAGQPARGSEGALADVAAERDRQRHKHGDNHDDVMHHRGDLAMAAYRLLGCYLQVSTSFVATALDHWNLAAKNPDARSRLRVAAALIIAEMDRIDRLRGRTAAKRPDAIVGSPHDGTRY